MISGELNIPPYRLDDLTVDQLHQAVAWCAQEQARRADQG